MLVNDRESADTASAQSRAKCQGKFSECRKTPPLHDEPSGTMRKPRLRGVEGSRRIAARPIELYRNNLVSLLTLLDVMRARCEAVCVQFVSDRL